MINQYLHISKAACTFAILFISIWKSMQNCHHMPWNISLEIVIHRGCTILSNFLRFFNDNLGCLHLYFLSVLQKKNQKYLNLIYYVQRFKFLIIPKYFLLSQISKGICMIFWIYLCATIKAIYKSKLKFILCISHLLYVVDRILK